MKTRHILLAAALLGGLLSTSALAITTGAHDKTAKAVFEAPVPAVVVHPMDLSPSLRDETVRLALTIDENGQPHNVRSLYSENQKILRNVISAVSQWKFTPAKKNGVPVAINAVLSLQLVES